MYKDIKIKKLDGSRVEITGSVNAEDFSSFKKKALQNINNEVTIDGFRKGKAPENVLVAKVGEMTILEEMAELALSKVYPEIIITEKIDAIGHPEIGITKLAANNPLEFKIVTTVAPELKLPDYKKIAKKEMNKVDEKIEVTEKEIGDALLRIQKSRVDHSGHDHEKMTPEEHEKLVMESLPKVDDAFAQSLGDFKDVADLKEKLKASILEDKVSKSREKKRITISDDIIDETECEIPALLTDTEVRRIETQFSDDIARMNVTLEDYLKHAKKSIEEIRAEWRPHAERKAKLQLVLNKIATLENIVADKKDIDEEVEHILSHYQDADRERAEVYAETVLTNEKVFQFLEAQK